MQEGLKKYIKETFSLGLSILIHCLLFFAFQTKISAQKMEIVPNEDLKQGENEKELEVDDEIIIKEYDYIDVFIDLESFKEKPKQKIIVPKYEKKIVKKEQIDKRGIYKAVRKNLQGNQTGNVDGTSSGTKLEINGWMWDEKPVVNDTSNEVGKIVFEFKIDAMGYVIGIKTLSKTVSNQVEKLYRDAVLNLTFKKIDDIEPQEETIGRIIFTIVYSE